MSENVSQGSDIGAGGLTRQGGGGRAGVWSLCFQKRNQGESSHLSPRPGVLVGILRMFWECPGQVIELPVERIVFT